MRYHRLIRRLVLALTLLPMFAAGQAIDVYVTGIPPIVDLGRGLSWSASGNGGLNNSFILPTPNASTGGTGWCIYIANNSGTINTVVPQAFTTGDQRVATYQGNTARWSGVATSTTRAGALLTVQANATASFFALTGAAARVTILFSSGSGAGTADVFGIATNASSCQGGNSLAQQSNGFFPPVQCNAIAGPVSVAPGASAVVLPANGLPQYVCGFTISQPLVPTTAGINGFTGSTSGASCTSLTMRWPAGGIVAGSYGQGGGLGYVFSFTDASLCYTNANTGGGNISVSIFYTNLF